MLDLKKVKIIGEQPVLATDSDVDQLEFQLKVSLPDGYREYVTTLGEGVLGGFFVRIYPPWRISKAVNAWRDRIRQYWFWDQGKDVLSKNQALESIIIGDSTNGDELIFHPENPRRLMILPRDEEVIFVAGSNLLEAVEWMCSSGKLIRRFKARNFEPFDTRGR